MTRASALLAVLTLTLALPAASHARVYKWRVSGSLTGTYTNSVSAYNCEETHAIASFSEVLHVNAKLVPLGTSTWRPGRGFGASLRVVPGGDWRQTGTFPERHVDPITEQPSCDPPQPIDCKGLVEFDPHGRRVATAIGFDPVGRQLLGFVSGFRDFFESAEVREIPGPRICNTYQEDGIQMARPLFGLHSSALVSSAIIQPVRVPAAKLRARRTFTFTGSRSKPDPDDCADVWLTCSQSGGVVLKLRFTPVRR